MSTTNETQIPDEVDGETSPPPVVADSCATGVKCVTRTPPVVGNSCATGVKCVTRRGNLPPPGAGHSCAPGDKSATRSSKAAAHRRGSRPLPDVPSSKWSHIQHRRPLINMKELTKLGTLNVRTLSCRWRLGELTFAAAKMGITALGIQEHRLQCTEDVRHMDMGRGWKLVHSTADARRVGGVGLLLSPRAYSALEAVTLISTRILLFSFTTSNRSMPRLTIIVCYSPTSASSEAAIDNFYSDLQKTVDSIGRHTFLSIFW